MDNLLEKTLPKNVGAGFYQSSFKEEKSFKPEILINNISTSSDLLAEEFVLGIDEAGRGPVLGPMVYTAFFYPKAKEAEILQKVKLADSKALKDEDRQSICDKLIDLGVHFGIGWYSRILSPANISNSMLRKVKYNLNDLSHDTVIDLVQLISSNYSQIRIAEMFVDTVGPPEYYQSKLLQHLSHIVPKITVSKKADSLYPCVSGASIVAKVTRDYVLRTWKCQEERIGGLTMGDRDFGSGYPGDPKTISWLQANLDPVFGFPDIIRFSWSTCEKLVAANGVNVKWPEDANSEEYHRNNNNNNSNSNKRSSSGTFMKATQPKSSKQHDPMFAFLKVQ